MKTLISLLLYLTCASAWSQCSPIVIDTRRDGIELGPAGRGVSFDVNADGFPDRVQWVRPGGDEAFLTLDRNRNGVVDDGSELFGVGTPLLAGGTAPNGFVGLAQYDPPVISRIWSLDHPIEIKEGMVFALETQHGRKFEWGVRIEEMLIVHKDKVEIISNFPVEQITVVDPMPGYSTLSPAR